MRLPLLHLFCLFIGKQSNNIWVYSFHPSGLTSIMTEKERKEIVEMVDDRITMRRQQIVSKELVIRVLDI